MLKVTHKLHQNFGRKLHKPSKISGVTDATQHLRVKQMTMMANYSKTEWRSVWRDYRARIANGELRPGDKLPSLAALATKHGITLHAARKVVAELSRADMVVSWQGVGSYVRQPSIDYYIDQRTQFAKNIERNGYQCSTEIIQKSYIPASGSLAQDLGARHGELVLLVELLRNVNGRPTMIGRHHFLAKRYRELEKVLSATGSVSTALASFGIKDFRRRETLIYSRLPTEKEALLLQIPRSQSVIGAIGINVQPDDTVIEVAHSVSRGDCVRFRV